MTLQEQEDREEAQDREDELARDRLEEQELNEAGSIGEGPDNFGDLEAMLNKYGEPQQKQLASLPPQTMTDAGGGLFKTDGSSPIRDYESQLPDTQLNPKLMRKGLDRFGMTPVDEPLLPVPEPVWNTVPQVGGKTTQVGPSRFNPSKFKMPEDFNAPSEEYEDPTLDQTPSQNTDNKDANRQRLLAYLGMGTQDAITGMTGFKGDTNVYDQMLLAARQKNKDATNKQDKINNFLKQKNAWKIANRKLEQGERFHKDKLNYDAWAEGEKNRLTAWEKSGAAKGEEETKGMQKFGMNTADMAQDWLHEGGASRSYGALDVYKDAINKLKTDPDYQPDRLNNYLQLLSGVTPGEAEIRFPKIHAMKQAIERTLLAALRPTFGAQFTENEGRMLLNTAFNPRLRPEDNIAGLEDWSKNIGNIIRNRRRTVQWFGDHRGDMRGFPIVEEPIIEEVVSQGKAK